MWFVLPIRSLDHPVSLSVMLNGVAQDIIDDEECRTHIVFTRAAQLNAVQLWEMISKSKLVYPDPVEFNRYAAAAKHCVL